MSLPALTTLFTVRPFDPLPVPLTGRGKQDSQGDGVVQGVVKEEHVNIHHVHSLNLQLQGRHEHVRQKAGSHVTVRDSLRLHFDLGVALVWSVSKCAGHRTHTHTCIPPHGKKNPDHKQTIPVGQTHTPVQTHSSLMITHEESVDEEC